MYQVIAKVGVELFLNWSTCTMTNGDVEFKVGGLDIGAEEVERFKAQRKGETVVRFRAKKKTLISPATVNRELACLKTVFNKAVEWGRLRK